MIYDVAIIGAGMAGVSLAAELDPKLSVLILEAETLPGYHATGRSAAFWDECYGGLALQPLTTASGPFLASPSPDFSDRSFLRKRGSLYLGNAANASDLTNFYRIFSESGVKLDWLERDEVAHLIPGLKASWTCGVAGPDCSDIDVAALHMAYLRKAKSNGVHLAVNAALDHADFSAGHWTLNAGSEQWKARLLVNAAGAWADNVAEISGVAPLGHQPRRRTIIQIRTDPASTEALPLVIDFNGQFYFKPETNGRLWLSPHDETDSPPCDVAPEEIDIATAIDRLAAVVDWSVERVERSWAGLRTFAPDRLPVFGHDTSAENFFWCTGQGGFGIQTAPAAAKLCAAKIAGTSLAANLAGIDPARFAPGRFKI